jgi:hypothetical protein
MKRILVKTMKPDRFLDLEENEHPLALNVVGGSEYGTQIYVLILKSDNPPAYMAESYDNFVLGGQVLDG